MWTRSPASLFCRWCGRAIAKLSIHVYVEEEKTQYHHPGQLSRYIYIGKGKKLHSIDECRPYTNEQILSVKYWNEINDGEIGERYVKSFNVWDGESYVDEFFCTNTCAQALGRAAAQKGFATNRWRDKQGRVA